MSTEQAMEKIKKYAKDYWDESDNKLNRIDACIDGGSYVILHPEEFGLLKEQGWIDFCEKQPETEGEYLITNGKQWQMVANFKFFRMRITGELVTEDGITGVFSDNLGYAVGLKYWMKLPEPPK